VPLLVQSKGGNGTGTSLSLTLAAGTTAANCLAVAAGSFASTTRTVSGITLGGSAGNFALAKGQTQTGSEDVRCEIWTDQNCAGGQTAVAITYSGSATVNAGWAEEWSGILTSAAVDKTNGGGATTTSWSSGATGTLTQASEVVLGAVFCFTGSTLTITPPGSPWTNLGQQGASSGGGLQAGYQIVTATTSLTYNGTQNGVSVEVNAAVIVTLKAAAAGAVSPFTQPRAAKGAAGAVRGSSRSSPGAQYVAFPSAFTLPGRPSRGTPATARGKSETIAGKYIRVIPPGPSPFYLPGHAARGGTPPARGRPLSTPGAPYMFFPSRFTLPGGPARGRPLLNRGRSSASAGARFVLIRISPFTLPRAPARGRAAIRAGRSSAGSATGQGAPQVPRTLIIALASTAGTDDYGNEFGEGVTVGPSSSPQVYIKPGAGAGAAAEVQFPISAAALSNTPNIAAGLGEGNVPLLLASGPASSTPGDGDWVQLELWANDGEGTPATAYFNYIGTGGGSVVTAQYDANWTFKSGVTFDQAVAFDSTATFNDQAYNPNGNPIFNWSGDPSYPIPTDPNTGSTWATGERDYINNCVNLINYMYSVLVDAGILAS
jgi:hypothetical protein